MAETNPAMTICHRPQADRIMSLDSEIFADSPPV